MGLLWNLNLNKCTRFTALLTVIIVTITIPVFAQTAFTSVAAQPDGYSGPEFPHAGASKADLLSLPGDGSPVVVRAAFHLQDINEIDEEAERSNLPASLPSLGRTGGRLLIPKKHRPKKRFIRAIISLTNCHLPGIPK